MKRKGFTLIELLAVIVILAIIALIATPIIINVIEKAKKGAAESSALGYLNAVESQVAINAVDTSKEDIVDGKYEVSQLSTKGVSIKGNGPTSGTVTITKGEVTACSLVIDKYTVTCLGNGKVQVENEEKKEPGITVEEPDLTKTRGLLKIVYLDPTDYTKKCDSSNSVSTTGTKEGCMKWYAFAETETTYDLILDHNTTALVAWNSDNTNTEMQELKIALETDKKDWIEEIKNTARIITADEIAEITGAKEALDWTSDKEFIIHTSTPEKGVNITTFFLDGAEGTDIMWQKQVAKVQGASKYAWLYDNTKECTNYGCNIEDSSNYGYWTSNTIVSDSNAAWTVFRFGTLTYSTLANDAGYGVRPVITLSKSLISES